MAGAEALLERYPGVFTILSVAPGLNGFISDLLDIRLLPKDRHMVLTTPSAGGRQGGNDRPLATGALDDDTFRAPLVDLAELHVLYLLAPPLRSITFTAQLPLSPPKVSDARQLCYYYSCAPYLLLCPLSKRTNGD